MSEVLTARPKAPGIVILVAILNFLSAATFGFFMALSLAALIFGNVLGLADFVTTEMTRYATNPNFSYSLTLVFAFAALVLGGFFLFFLAIGIGLVKGKRFAWYFQIAMSVISLISFPVSAVFNPFLLPFGAILNVLILVLFFRTPVRDYFRV